MGTKYTIEFETQEQEDLTDDHSPIQALLCAQLDLLFSSGLIKEWRLERDNGTLKLNEEALN